MSKHCVACGMPMTSADDFAMGDSTKSHCKHCARPDGTMKSQQEVLDGMTAFIVRTQGMDETAARAMASEMMGKLPAWQ
ncbi:MAG: zinc ribbon domain-containing protein [Phycisphaerales bacterium]|nr:zinc ribbon domain-containing protein [Phycisphaerales bacterium]MCB9862651.1 zinc ribbon domain-containing protein [Phycisphaerales bacterium]